jgi:hypothetical protein
MSVTSVTLRLSVDGGLVVSASLLASPQGSDHLILFRFEEGRRMVSEDSQNLGWLPVVHRLLDLRDLDDPGGREMLAHLHQSDDPCELLEVVPLRSPQWVLPEERHDPGAEVIESVDVVSEEILTMIITSAIPIDPATAEESNQLLERIATRRSLHDVERRSYLPTKRHLAIPVDGAAEAALSIHEPHDPSDGREPFLLVFRTLHVVTASHRLDVTSSL